MSLRLASFTATLLTTASLCCLSQSAWAGKTELADFAADCPTADLCADPTTMTVSNYAFDGQYWHAPDIHPSPGTASFGTLNIPLDFGSGPVTGRHILFNGVDGLVTFVDDSKNPTGDFISPLGVKGGYSTNYVNGFYTYGELDPSLLTGPAKSSYTYNPTTTLKAYRFDFPATCPLILANSAGDCTDFDDFTNFQAVLIALNDEDFVLQFNYQNFVDPPAGSTGTFALGANTNAATPYTGPFLSAGPDYCFHAGSLVSCNALLGIPEPNTPMLFALGLALFAFATWRRRGGVFVRR